MTWRRYVPDISLHEALRTMSPQPASSPVLPDQSVIETEPLNADDLEFDESQGFSDLVDGMVSLTVDPHGYMGTESGSAALKFLNELSASTPRSTSAGSSTGAATATLTRPPELTRLLDDYFAHYHPAYPILHEPTFRAQISGKRPQLPSAPRFPALTPRQAPWPSREMARGRCCTTSCLPSARLWAPQARAGRTYSCTKLPAPT